MRRKRPRQALPCGVTGTKLNLVMTRHPIHFDDLSPSDFERMCLWLVKAEGYLDAEHVGLLGGDDGCDVKAWKRAGATRRLWWFQCKRRARVERRELIGELEKIHKYIETIGAEKPAGICFVLAAPVSAATRRAIEGRGAAHGYRCRWWARTELDMLLKSHPTVVDEFVSLGAPARGVEPEMVRPYNQLPSAPGDFTGREEELEALVKASEIGKGSALPSCIRGMAGVGKTALALVAANHVADRFRDGQVFLNLRGASEQRPLSPAEAMAHVIQAFHPREVLPKEIERVAPIYRSILRGKRVLLLFDNALDADQVRLLIPPETCWMLITSRQHFHLPGLEVIDLDVLPKRHACELLRRICHRIGEVDESIAELCGHLPLALRAAASLLEVRRDLSVSEYARLLKDEQSRLRRLGREGVEASVEASLALSYRLLPKNLRQAFCMLAVFRGMIHTNAAAAVWRVKPETARDRLGAFLRLSLLDWDEKTYRYRLHELVRLFADTHLTTSNRRQAQLGHALCFCFTLSHAQRLYLKGAQSMVEGLILFDTEWANIDAGHEWAVANAQSDKRLKRFPSLYALAGEEFFPIRLHPQRRLAWLEPALAAAQAMGDTAAAGTHLTGLGIAYYDWGDPLKAMKYHKRVLALVRRTRNRQGEAAALCNLGNCNFLLGDMKKAVRYHERSLRTSRELGDRRAEGKSLGNLANAYSRLGQKEQALAHYQQQLAVARELGDREQEGNALHGMGVTYSNGHEISQAIDCHEKALVIAKEMGNTQLEGGALSGLASQQFALGNVSQAIDLCHQAIEKAQTAGDRRGEAMFLNNLATSLWHQRDAKQATTSWHKALAIFRELDDRAAAADVLSRLGRMHLDLQEYQAARPHVEEALPIFHDLKEQEEEAACMSNLGTIYTFLGENDLAIAFFRDAADLYHQLGDKMNEGGILCNLGDRYARTNRLELAIECCNRALGILQEAGARKTECACLSNLANAHRLLGHADKAREYCDRQLHLARDIGDKLQEANALCGTAILNGDQGDHERAVAGYKHAAELHGEIGDHANKGNDLFQLCRELEILGRQQEAMRALEEAVDAFETISSPQTAKARALLALMQHA